MECAAVAHLVERHLAKVEVASSSLVGRSILWKFSSAGRASALQAEGQRFEPVNFHHVARWLSWLEHQPVTLGVVGSSPIRVASSECQSFVWQSYK